MFEIIYEIFFKPEKFNFLYARFVEICSKTAFKMLSVDLCKLTKNKYSTALDSGSNYKLFKRNCCKNFA